MMIASKKISLVALLALGLIAAACGDAQDADSDGMWSMSDSMRMSEESDGSAQAMSESMGGMSMPAGYVPDSLAGMNLAPLVKAYHEDGDAYFIHLEASDPEIAQTLTRMMGPDVVLLPELAQVSTDLTAPIYVFENGVEGMGPLGYQPDILESIPGDASYRPLNRIRLVTWHEEASPRELTSLSALRDAERQGRLTIDDSGIVVNAPVLAWPSGHRGMNARRRGMAGR